MEILSMIGGFIAVIGWIWLIIIGLKKGGILWSVLIILFSWIGGLIFAIVYKTGWLQLGLMIAGLIIAGIGLAPKLSQMIQNMS